MIGSTLWFGGVMQEPKLSGELLFRREEQPSGALRDTSLRVPESNYEAVVEGPG